MKLDVDEVRRWRLRARQLRELGSFEKDPKVSKDFLTMAAALEVKIDAAGFAESEIGIPSPSH